MAIPIGTKVWHDGHGLGTVIGHNGIQRNRYFEEKPKDAVEIANKAGLLHGLLASFYNGDRYPNIIQFGNGYKDVYADCEVRVIN